MHKLFCSLSAFFVASAVVCHGQGAVAEPRALNPIIWADVPDWAIIRVGDVYYMSSTTMHMSPGLPIMKSKDLVNWEMISYAYETLGDNAALTLQDGKTAYGAGSWASSLRFHDGMFYVSTFSGTTGKTYIYKTKDPEKGPWEETAFKPSLHDHSLFFEDGRAYMVHGGGNLRLTELKPDLSGVLPGGLDQVIVHNAQGIASTPDKFGLPAEGSQLFKINGKYYLINITWPKGDMRTALVHRADKLTGPYEGRILFHDQGVAQGGLIDTPSGEWFAYLFKDNGPVGRIPYLVPVKWADGWPVLGVDGKLPKSLDLPAAKPGVPGAVAASDEFSRAQGDRPLPLVWQWNHNPDNALWSLTAKPGFLRLTTGKVVENLTQARNTLTQRTFGPVSSANTAIDVGGMKDGDYAGLTAFQKKFGFVGVKAEGDKRFIVMVSAGSDIPVEVASVPLAQDRVYLKADCNFRDGANKAVFYYSLDGETWTRFGEPVKMVYTLPHFIGYRFGLFNYATKTTGGSVDFDYLRVSDRIGSEN